MNKALFESTLYTRGRWYTVKLSSDGSDITIESCDSELTGASITSTYLKTVENFHVIDYKLDISLTEVSSATSVNYGIRQFTDGIQGITIPAKANFTTCTVSIFGYFE